MDLPKINTNYYIIYKWIFIIKINNLWTILHHLNLPQIKFNLFLLRQEEINRPSKVSKISDKQVLKNRVLKMLSLWTILSIWLKTERGKVWPRTNFQIYNKMKLLLRNRMKIKLSLTNENTSEKLKGWHAVAFISSNNILRNLNKKRSSTIWKQNKKTSKKFSITKNKPKLGCSALSIITPTYSFGCWR